jgi:hypothetical protein
MVAKVEPMSQAEIDASVPEKEEEHVNDTEFV